MDSRGYYEGFGGAYLPEILVATFDELEATFRQAKQDPDFWKEYADLMATYSCRPTPLTFARNLTDTLGGAKIYIKREDLNHTGAHKANNVMGQGLLVQKMGKTRVIAETGAGQHGVATATMAAKFGFACTIYMGEVDVQRLVRDLADELGMTGAIATVAEVVDGRYSGRLAEPFCYGPGKAEGIGKLAAARGYDLEICYAYSDSISDLPMLEVVGHPVAVNPDRPLEAVARSRGWPIEPTFTSAFCSSVSYTPPSSSGL